MGPLRKWLTDRGSLTARIIEHAADFNLQRVAQHHAPPFIDEYRALNLKQNDHALIREVLVRDGETPLIFAHTVVALRDLHGAWRGLSRLGSRPLADMLFNDATVVRLPMEYRGLDHRHPLYRRAASVCGALPPNLWARRSVFLKRGRPLMVSEVFVRLPIRSHNAKEKR